MKRFEDKVVVITGGAQGIGRCIADEFKKEGAHICIIDLKENEYVKSITKNNENYYVAFYQNGKKINESNVDIDIQNSNKVLNIYDNEGNIIDTSNNSINLRKNNYFMTISNIIDNEDNNYKIIDVNSFIEDLKDIEINSNSNIQIYNKHIPQKIPEKLYFLSYTCRML